MSETKTKEELNFDEMYLGYGDNEGGHITSIKSERAGEEDGELLLSPEAIRFCKLVVIYGMLPSEAYSQAFAVADEFGVLTVPELPSYQSRQLLKLAEVKSEIKTLRTEIREWSKTEVEEVELNLRRIAFSESEKTSDRLTATKALSNLRGFDAQPDMSGAGANISFILPFQPKNLSPSKNVTLDSQPLTE